MRALLATYGTMGDVQPFLALAVELRRRGHTATLAAPPGFADRAAEIGVPFVPLGPPLNLKQTWLAHRGSNAAEQAQQVLSWFLPVAPQIYEQLLGLCREHDVMVAFPFLVVASMAHEVTQVPYVSVSFSPFGVLGSKRLAAETVTTNELRARLGLPPVADPLGFDALSRQLALYAVSPSVFGRPRAWPPHHHLTGYFFLDEEWTPPAELEAFLENGEPPVVLSFGSVLHDDPEALTNEVFRALELTGRRAIVQRGWSGLAKRDLPDGVLAIDFAPHSWLFPRAACVVQAGGAGTLAATLRAGKPLVIVPHVLDQPLWAAIMRERGCAGPVVPYREITAQSLAAAIDESLNTPSIAAAAATLGARIRAENGVSDAVGRIEELVGATAGARR